MDIIIATPPGYCKTAFSVSLSLSESYTKTMAVRLYLKVGDIVEHLRFPHWGRGEVIQEQHSTLTGGFCMVRILFEDEGERAFINDLDNACCCYYAGIRLI
jgi:hypothetical protein